MSLEIHVAGMDTSSLCPVCISVSSHFSPFSTSPVISKHIIRAIHFLASILGMRPLDTVRCI
jgi:hypothetical protein